MNNLTAPVSFRIHLDQIEALKRLPDGVSRNDIVRALLKEYLEGRLPQVHAKVLEEVARKNEAQSRGHQAIELLNAEKKARTIHGPAGKQLSDAGRTLREQLRASLKLCDNQSRATRSSGSR